MCNAMKYGVWSFLASILVAVSILSDVASAQDRAAAVRGAIGTEVFDSIQARITSVQKKLKSSKRLTAQNHKDIRNQEEIIRSAGRKVDEMIAEYKGMIEEFKDGGDYQGALLRAQERIQAHIDQFKGGSEVQKGVAVELGKIKVSFADFEQRRKVTLGKALRAVRELEARKDDIKALMVLAGYKGLEGILGKMISNFETTTGDVEGINGNLAKFVGIPVE